MIQLTALPTAPASGITRPAGITLSTASDFALALADVAGGGALVPATAPGFAVNVPDGQRLNFASAGKNVPADAGIVSPPLTTTTAGITADIAIPPAPLVATTMPPSIVPAEPVALTHPGQAAAEREGTPTPVTGPQVQAPALVDTSGVGSAAGRPSAVLVPIDDEPVRQHTLASDDAKTPNLKVDRSAGPPVPRQKLATTASNDDGSIKSDAGDDEQVVPGSRSAEYDILPPPVTITVAAAPAAPVHAAPILDRSAERTSDPLPSAERGAPVQRAEPVAARDPRSADRLLAGYGSTLPPAASDAPIRSSSPAATQPGDATAALLPPTPVQSTAVLLPQLRSATPLAVASRPPVPALDQASVVDPVRTIVASGPAPAAVDEAAPTSPTWSPPSLPTPTTVRPSTPEHVAARADFPISPTVTITVAALPAPQPLAADIQPAAQAFAAAMFATAQPERADAADDPALPIELIVGDRSGALQPTPLAVPEAARPVEAKLDLTADTWMASMIDRIETLRDEGGAVRETRMKLAPDALGRVEISVSHDDAGQLQVRIAADTPQARAILTDAAPRLAEMAEARGLRLGGSGVDGGGASNDGTRREGQHQPASPIPHRPIRAAASDAAHTPNDSRIA